MKRASGFTLIEMLIASAILVMVLLVGTFAYSLFADKWNKKLGQVNALAEQVRTLTLIDQLLDGVVPLTLHSQQQKGFYFIGNKQSLTAISHNGIMSTDMPVVFRLFLDKANDGSNSLWYEESSIDSLLIFKHDQEISFSAPKLLMKDIAIAEFSYFGWHSFEAKSLAGFDPSALVQKAGWQSIYQGWQQQLHPEQLRLTIQTTAGQITFSSQYTQNSEILLREFDGG